MMGMEKKPLVIFGASGGAIKVAHTLEGMGVLYEFFVDNDSNKWDKEIDGKLIYSPQVLLDKEYDILIASDYQSEIEEQLEGMGLINHIVLKEELILKHLNQHLKNKDLNAIVSGKIENSTVIIDLIEGIGLGGIETWSFMIAKELINKGMDTYVFTSEGDDLPPKDLKDSIEYFNTDYKSYTKTVESIMDSIIPKLPCTIISNWQSQVMIAGIMIKARFPDKINIVSVLHNDKIAIYRRQKYLEPYTDKIACVSRKIKEHMQNDFDISSTKLFYKESPVDFDSNLIKSYNVDNNQPIQIGFAARIDKFQKRADLLVQLIKELERNKILYQLNVAGIGSYFSKLQSFVTENKLQERVHLLGLVDRSEMAKFWQNQDIFLSVSDFEGASISMLEAMSYGVVPVVTDVSGVSEFIKDKENGIICPVGDAKGIARGILELDHSRDLLYCYGNISRNVIKEKCDKVEYVAYIMNLIELLT